jgi:isoamylase/glycogen operon protein
LALLVSQGIPMLLMGDEYGHTRKGNNNSWCQDNALNWFLWNELEKNASFYRFYKALIHFRNAHEILRQNIFLGKENIVWHGITPLMPQWHDNIAFLSFTLIDQKNEEDLYLAFNASNESLNITLPEVSSDRRWHWIVNTANDAPLDFFDPPLVVTEPVFSLLPHSAVMTKAIKD